MTKHADAWVLSYDRFDPAEEKLREALCTLGNGYFATRGAAPEAVAGDTHYPGTYLAGIYNRLSTVIGGQAIEHESLVNAPNWLPLRFRVNGGDWFDTGSAELLDYRQELDLKKGVLLRRFRFAHDDGLETSLTQRRFVSMADPHMAGMETVLVPENWSGPMEVTTGLDAGVRNAGVKRYADLAGRHLNVISSEVIDGSVARVVVETNQSRVRIAEACRSRLLVRGRSGQVPTPRNSEFFAGHDYLVDVARGEEVYIEKIVSVFTSRDAATSEPGEDAERAVRGAGDFDSLLRQHAMAWEHTWRVSDMAIADGARTSLAVRLHIFHLLQTVSEHTVDLDAGVPARGLHGEAYRGHVFWDELFIFPFLNLRFPERTRALLKYRYRRLPEARRAARQAGLRGALFPWQSGSTGREESQTLHLNPRSGRWLPDDSSLQRHIASAVAFNVWQYYQTTLDHEFLDLYGAEILFEVARFWSSMATYNRALDRYEILGVMGPDEYHDRYPGADRPGLNNNAYTNLLAVWVFGKALEALKLIPRYRAALLRERLQLTSEELGRWEELGRKMRVVMRDDGIISQFEGYEDLEEFDWDGYREKYGDIQRLDRILEAEGDSTNRYKLSKQADVLMLFYLLSAEELGGLFEQLGLPFEYETIPANARYYLSRTSHGSTLSRVVHSWVLARTDRAHSWRLFSDALESDLADIQGGTTHEGIHLGAMAGTLDLLQRGYAGLEVWGHTLSINPLLPDELNRLKFDAAYRGDRFQIRITGDSLAVTASHLRGRSMQINVRGQDVEVEAGATVEIDLGRRSRTRR